jgi:hypothetical protein
MHVTRSPIRPEWREWLPAEGWDGYWDVDLEEED